MFNFYDISIKYLLCPFLLLLRWCPATYDPSFPAKMRPKIRPPKPQCQIPQLVIGVPSSSKRRCKGPTWVLRGPRRRMNPPRRSGSRWGKFRPNRCSIRIRYRCCWLGPKCSKLRWAILCKNSL